MQEKLKCISVQPVENGYIVQAIWECGCIKHWIYTEASHATDKAEEILVNAKKEHNNV